MEIRVLKYYLAVAREGSLTAASRILHVTQPTLSRQLKDLEQELGKKLFIRSNYKVILTQEGILFRKRAEDIVEMVEKTTREFQSMDDDYISGDVYIGAGETEKLSYIGNMIKELNAAYPGIRYHFSTGNLKSVTERLDKGLIDFAIVFPDFNTDKYNYTELPYTDRWGLIMRKDSPLTQKPQISPQDLCGLPLIVSQQALHREIALWMGENFRHANIISTYDLLYNASILVKTGVGYALGLDGIISTGNDSELCFRPLYPAITTNILILWRKHHTFSKAAKVFYDRLMLEYI